MEVQIFVVNRERPLDLVERRRTIKVAGVVGRRERTAEPALVEPHPIGVNRLDEVPRIAEFVAQRGIFAQAARQIFDRHRANRLVRMRTAKDERLLLAALDRQQLDRDRPAASRPTTRIDTRSG